MNVCAVEFAPLAKTCRMAPPALPARVGLPTSVLGLPFSLPLPVIFRLLGSAPPGFCFTVKDLPRDGLVNGKCQARCTAEAHGHRQEL